MYILLCCVALNYTTDPSIWKVRFLNSYTFYIYAFPACKNAEKSDGFRHRFGQGVSRNFPVYFVSWKEYLFSEFQLSSIVFPVFFPAFLHKKRRFLPLYFSYCDRKKALFYLHFLLKNGTFFPLFAAAFLPLFRVVFRQKAVCFFIWFLKINFYIFVEYCKYL